MARPKKDPALRMGTDLRIPLTTDQKALIQTAIADNPSGLASWARSILLEAAAKKIRKTSGNSEQFTKRLDETS